MNQFRTNITPINIILNLNHSENNVNRHWWLCCINDNKNVYYSSFGDPIPNQFKLWIIEVVDRKVLSNIFQIEDCNTDT